METNEHHMLPIWFIIGINLLVYGVVIAITGLVHWNSPPSNVQMSELHIDFWWGTFMTVLGLFYTIRFWPCSARQSSGEGPAAGTGPRKS